MGQYSVSIQNGEKNLFQKSTAKFKKKNQKPRRRKITKRPSPLLYLYTRPARASHRGKRKVSPRQVYLPVLTGHAWPAGWHAPRRRFTLNHDMGDTALACFFPLLSFKVGSKRALKRRRGEEEKWTERGEREAIDPSLLRLGVLKEEYLKM